MNAISLLSICSVSLIAGTSPVRGEGARHSGSILPVQMTDSNMLVSRGWSEVEFCRAYATKLAKQDGRPEGQSYALGANPKLCFAFIDRNLELFDEWQQRRSTEARRFYCSLLNEKSLSWSACKAELGDQR
jgi:hypothetical protein